MNYCIVLNELLHRFKYTIQVTDLMFYVSMANDEIQNVYVVSNIRSFSIFV